LPADRIAGVVDDLGNATGSRSDAVHAVGVGNDLDYRSIERPDLV
jgi:hypothetical protein